MKLRSKTMLVLAGVLTFSVALNFGVLQKLVFPSFASLEQSAAEQNLERVEDALKGEIRSMIGKAQDWAHWNDTYEYVVGEHPTYEEDNLFYEALSGLSLNFMYLYNSSGEIQWAGLYDLETEDPIPQDDFLLNNLPASHPLLQHRIEDEDLGTHSGIVLTSQGPVLLVSSAVLTSEIEGPNRGSFIIGHLLNETEINRLRELTHVDFQIWPLDGSRLQPAEQEAMTRIGGGDEMVIVEQGEAALSGYSTLSDPSGAPVVLLRADTPRDITAIGQDTINYALVFMLLVGAVDMIAMWFLLRFVVIGPLTNLTTQVLSIAQEEDHGRRLSIKSRSDEIGVLAMEFNSMLDKLLSKEALAVIGQVTATVSHELRNPLGAMRNSIFSIVDSKHGKDPDVERAVQRVDRNIQRCDNIIGDLIDFARQSKPNLAPVTIDTWLGDLLDKEERPEGIAVARELAAPGVEALIDKELFQCVIHNLVENAEQAIADSRNGDGAGGRIEVATRVVGDRLELSICDNGPGIPAEVLPKIFKPLFSTKGFGVGVGLPTVKRIIDQHDGEISVTSEGGSGTRAVVWLPLHMAKQAAA